MQAADVRVVRFMLAVVVPGKGTAEQRQNQNHCHSSGNSFTPFFAVCVRHPLTLLLLWYMETRQKPNHDSRRSCRSRGGVPAPGNRKCSCEPYLLKDVKS